MLDFIKNIFSGGAGNLVGSIGGIIDNLNLSKEEREKLKIETEKEINRHTETMEAETTRQYESFIKEMESARNREANIAGNEKVSWITRNTTALLAIVFVGTTLALYTLSILKAVEIHSDILQDLRDIVILIMGYYFGSSLSSSHKQKLIDRMAR